MMRKGLLIVYSGPSGVGKGTILGPYLKEHPEAVLSVSMTTRAPRPGETDGVEYHFVTREQFESEIAAGGLLEYAQYSGNYYGTPHRMVEEQRAQGRDVVLEIEVQGAAHIRKVCPDAVFIFVMPPSYETLENRLSGRAPNRPRWCSGVWKPRAPSCAVRPNMITSLSTMIWKRHVRVWAR